MKKLSVFVFFVLLLAGCASDGPKTPPLSHAVPVDPPSGSLMLTANTYAGDVLSVELLQRLGSGSGILAATMADMEELDDSSPFGRTSMQQVGSRVAQHGFKVLDVRLTDAMRMDLRKGEFMLSRDTARILAKEYNAHAVLVGLYSRSDDMIFVSVRAIRLDDAAIIGAYEYWLPKEGDVRAMLTNRKIGGEDLISKYTRRSKVSGTQPDVGCGAPVVTASSVQKAPPKAAAAPAPRRSHAGPAQGIAVQHGPNLTGTIGKHQGGGAVPRFHKRGVVFVKSTLVLTHNKGRAKRFRHQHHGGMGQASAPVKQQFKGVAQHGRIAAVGVKHRAYVAHVLAKQG